MDAHRALQAGLVPLGRALEQGSSPSQLRDLAAAKGLLVQDPIRVCIATVTMLMWKFHNTARCI